MADHLFELGLEPISLGFKNRHSPGSGERTRRYIRTPHVTAGVRCVGTCTSSSILHDREAIVYSWSEAIFVKDDGNVVLSHGVLV
jgi:hypothetical protein